MVDGEQPPGGPVDKERLHRLHGRGAGQAASLASTKRERLPRVSKISAEMSSSSTANSHCPPMAVTTVTTALESNHGNNRTRVGEGKRGSVLVDQGGHR